MPPEVSNAKKVNKVIYGNETLLDLTSDNVSAEKMLEGTTAHDKSGKEISGSIIERAPGDYLWSDGKFQLFDGYYQQFDIIVPILIHYFDQGHVYYSEWVDKGQNAQGPRKEPSKAATDTKMYFFLGWSTVSGATVADPDALKNITTETTFYSVYEERTAYKVTFMNGSTTLQTVMVPAGETAIYTGETPVSSKYYYKFTGWQPSNKNIFKNTTCVAQFEDTATQLQKYLAGTLTEYKNDQDTSLCTNAFYKHTSLQKVTSSASNIEYHAFTDCQVLNTVELTSLSAVKINSQPFLRCPNVAHLIIRSTTMSTLSGTYPLTGTQIEALFGAVYVPDALVSTYKADANWSKFNICRISEYPKTDFSTISDSWDTIAANCTNDTYKTKYKVGDTKIVEAGSTKFYARVVDLNNVDYMEDGALYIGARITWMSDRSIFSEKMNGSSGVKGGWPACSLRTTLNSTYFNSMPAALRSAIMSVTKKSKYGNSVLTSNDKVWIPSMSEVTTFNENDGTQYTLFANDNTVTTKANVFNSSTYWSRTSVNGFVNGNDEFYIIVSGRGASDRRGTLTDGVVIGFCT